MRYHLNLIPADARLPNSGNNEIAIKKVPEKGVVVRIFELSGQFKDYKQLPESLTALINQKFNNDGLSTDKDVIKRILSDLGHSPHVHSLLPTSASPQEKIIEAVTSGADILPTPMHNLWNADTCPEKFLPWLAWALSVDHWDSHWEESTKRAVIRESIPVHRKKGTRGAVERALSALDVKLNIAEWFDTGDQPHTFTVTALANSALDRIDGKVPDKALYREIQRNIDTTKPARSHYSLRVGADSRTGIKIGGVLQGSTLLRERARTQTRPMVSQNSIILASRFQGVSVVRLTMELNV